MTARGTLTDVRLQLTIDLDDLPADTAKEAGRILRYWAGAMDQLDLTAAVRHQLMDSQYRPVGELIIADAADGGVKQVLHRYLKGLHRDLLWKLSGLGEQEARWPRTRTGTNLLGLLKHVASVESEYFGSVFDRPFPEELPWSADDAEDNADMWAWPDETIGSVTDFAQRVFAHSDATIDALPLDAVGRVPWWGVDGQVTLATVLVHVVAEVARHAGHADIVRELTDGGAGLRERGANLPDHDEQWWADYVAKLQRVATEAAAGDR